jgi:hypothetical protein
VLKLGAGLIGLTSTYVAFTRAKVRPDSVQLTFWIHSVQTTFWIRVLLSLSVSAIMAQIGCEGGKPMNEFCRSPE